MKKIRLTLLLTIIIGISVQAQIRRLSNEEVKLATEEYIDEYKKQVIVYCSKIQKSHSKKEAKKYASKIANLSDSLNKVLTANYGSVDIKKSSGYTYKFLGGLVTINNTTIEVPGVSSHLNQIGDLADSISYLSNKKNTSKKVRRIKNTLISLSRFNSNVLISKL